MTRSSHLRAAAKPRAICAGCNWINSEQLSFAYPPNFPTLIANISPFPLPDMPSASAFSPLRVSALCVSFHRSGPPPNHRDFTPAEKWPCHRFRGPNAKIGIPLAIWPAIDVGTTDLQQIIVGRTLIFFWLTLHLGRT